jgi:AcrR family transcriptional regulator
MPDDAPSDVLAAAFALVAERGFAALSLAEVARRSGRTLAEVYAELPGRGALLERLGERVDRAMVAIPTAELAEMSPRERVFEAIMRRLDALETYRPGLAALRRDPAARLALGGRALCAADRTAARLVELSGLEDAVAACLARRGLALVYGRVFTVWLDDAAADRPATLAELDRRLGQLFWLIGDRPAGPAAAAA